MISAVATGVIFTYIIFASFASESKENKYAMRCFAYCSIAFKILNHMFGDEWGFTYYILAAIVDLIIINSISMLSNPTETAIRIQKITFWLIWVHLFGWIIYEAEKDPALYDFICGVLFMLLFITANEDGTRNVLGNTTIHWDGSAIRGYNHPSTAQMRSN